MEKILDLDHKSAVTIFSSVSIERDNPRDELGIVDLENYISQAIWRLFDSSRAEAAERLGVNEVDLLLTDARVMGIKIDGSRIIDPRGFAGKNVEVLLAITMVKRDRFTEGSYMLEGGSVRAYLLSKTLKSGDAVYMEIGDKGTAMYLINPSRISYISDFGWGGGAVIDEIIKEFGIPYDSAKKFYSRYAEDNVSTHVSKKIDKIFYNSFGEFINGTVMGIRNFVKPKAGKIPPIYVKSFVPVPASMHNKRFQADRWRIRLIPTGEDGGLEDFIGDEAHEIYKELNQLAQRRIKWLIPTN